MILLALETSCDETSAAVVEQGRIRANTVASQIRLHADYGGVVPELATREHLRHLMPVVQSAARAGGILLRHIDAVAATQGPGLPNALLIGFKTAQALAFALRRPLLGIHHHEAHLYSAWIDGASQTARFTDFAPNISLIVSGGHTLLVHVPALLQHTVLGSTVDDAAGECFDKVAKLIGLPYPGGPVLDQLAEEGNPAAFDFPRPLIGEARPDFSFSGLKTSVRYFLRDHPGLLGDRRGIVDVCASVRAAIVDVLVTKTLRAASRLGVRCVTASGGVTCNRELRRRLAAACAQAGYALRLADPQFCTDNAAMIGVLAEQKLARGRPSTSLDAEPRPSWELSELGVTSRYSTI